MKNRASRTICLLVFAGSLLSLASCATVQEPDWAEVTAKYDKLKRDIPDRVVFDFNPACNPATGNEPGPDGKDQCIVTRETLERGSSIITNLNTANQEWALSHNSLIDSLKDCQYGKEQRDATIDYQNNKLFRERLIGIGKQVVLASVCGLLLW